MSDTHNKPVGVIVGLGVTGLSCARYLLDRGWRVCVTDSRADPPGRAQLASLDPDITVRFGRLDTSLLDAGGVRGRLSRACRCRILSLPRRAGAASPLQVTLNCSR